MKLTNIVDEFVTQVVQFVGNILSTAFLFWRSPESLYAVVAGSATNAESFVSPITFLAACEFAFLLTLIAGHATAEDDVRKLSSRATFGPDVVWKTITEGDWKKLGLLAVPFFGVVAIHAGLWSMSPPRCWGTLSITGYRWELAATWSAFTFLCVRF